MIPFPDQQPASDIDLVENIMNQDDPDSPLILQRAILASLSMDSQPKQERPCLDKLLPLEIWEHIGGFLYPSQLCRLSRTSRTMYEYVGSLKV